MDIYKEMRDILFENGISSDSNSFGDEYFTDDIFNILKTNIRNYKGEDFNNRFRDIISDPNNLFIKITRLFLTTESILLYSKYGKLFKPHFRNSTVAVKK